MPNDEQGNYVSVFKKRFLNLVEVTFWKDVLKEYMNYLESNESNAWLVNSSSLS